GAYSFTGIIAPGTYTVETSSYCFSDDVVCYTDMFFDNALVASEATTITVLAGQITSDVNFALKERGQIRGTVSTEDNGPFYSSSVRMYQVNGESYSSVGTAYVNISEPNFVFHVDPGTYYFEVIGENPYVDSFYGGTSAETAARVEVEQSEIIENIDLTLKLGGTVSVTSFVDSQSGLPIENVNLELIPQNSSLNSINSNSEISGLQTGLYFVKFSHPDYADIFYGDSALISTTKPVFVEEGETTILEEDNLTRLAKISGSVTVIGESDSFNLTLYPLEKDYFISGGVSSTAFEFTFDANQLPSDSVTIGFEPLSGCGNYIINRCYLPKYAAFGISDTQSTATKLEIKNGQTISDLNIEIEFTSHSKITGTVTDESTGQFVQNATVSLHTTKSDLSPLMSYNLNCETIPQHCEDGYEFMVIPGSYYVSVEADGYKSRYFPNNDRETATPISINNHGEVISANFTLQPALGSSVSGYITDEVTGNPIENVTVLLEGDKFTQYLTKSDENGFFEFQNISAGEYTLLSQYYGDYVRTYFGTNALTIDETEKIILEDGQDFSADLSLQKGGSLEAVFVNAETNQTITWTRPHGELYQADGSYYLPSRQSVQAEGKLKMTAIPEGDYYFQSVNGITEYFERADTFEKATLIKITQGLTSTIQVPIRFNNHWISLLFEDLPFEERKEIQVQIQQVDNECGEYEIVFDEKIINSDTILGHFHPDYSYQVLVNHQAQALNSFLPYTIDNINFGNPQQQTQYTLSLSEGGLISGLVTDSEHDHPLDNVGVKVFKKEIISGEAQFNLVSESFTDENGNYQSKGLYAGEYAVLFDTTHHPELAFASQFYGSDNFSFIPEKANAQIVTLGNQEQISINQSLEKGGSIIGHASDKTGTVFVSTEVSLYEKYNDQLVLLKTDSFHAGQKQFWFSGLGEGDYYLLSNPYNFNGDNYRPLWHGGTQIAKDATPISIGSGTLVDNVDFIHDAGGRISGNISLDKFSAGFEDRNITPETTSIKVFDLDGNFVMEGVGYNMPWGDTDYSIQGIWPGTYKVLLDTYNLALEGPCNDRTFYGEWYGGASNFEDATPVVITGTNEIINIDGTLSEQNEPPTLPNALTQPYQLTGRVLNTSGNPVEGVTVTATPQSRTSQTSTQTNANGEYTLRLANGNYTITFAKEGYDFSQMSVAVIINGQNQTAANVVAPDPATQTKDGIYLPIINH
ncbi:MAG: carboxypeptidase regulatory-like domain-containing protein, partial [Chloroflexota bacterium]